ncbi:response regulator transcription factor [Ponticaulis sp.]|uniref:response regulator n=1 Tax=Ponticaulis sp. TaxID=2020902 RepID=UPI002614FF83|nr:response regulator transcription factor [Ponticaulis sp.]MDF1681676.1 response regulator transcription factor [Ponticaulis sp.]
MTPSRPAVLIVDDHPLFRDALKAALQKAFPDGADTAEAASITAAMSAVSDTRYDLLLLDLNIPDATGFDGLVKLKTAVGDAPVYVVSATEGGEAYARAQSLGASGYLPKSLSSEDLSAALVTALDGGTWFPVSEDGGLDAESEAVAARLASLTPAQRRVLNGLSDGLLNKQIAYEMGISEATVKAHMTAIFRKLGANNRTQALLIFKEATSAD